MMSQLITYYLETRGLSHNDQHGFRPGRGTGTAWRIILDRVVNSRDIMEFDLKGFFDNVNLEYINTKMKEKGIPED